jgi:hypothetical protein
VAAYSPSLAPAIPTAPQETDRLVWWLGSKLERDGAKLVIHHDMTDEQRAKLKQRRDELKKSLTEHNRQQMAADIGAALGCYPQFAKLSADEAKKLIAKYVSEMRGIPTWAVSRACYQIRTGSADDISKDYIPTTIRIRELAQAIAKPMVSEVIQIERLLRAEKYRPPATPEERERVKAGFATLVAEQKRWLKERDDAFEELRAAQGRKLAKADQRVMLAEYGRAGLDPVYAGDVLVSPSLARLLESLESTA